jgi:hypothetical protein
MKRTPLAVLLSLSAAIAALTLACSDSNPAPGPTPGSAPPRFTATLLASNEVPAFSNAESNATGAVVITLNTTKDAAGNITSATADFQVTLANFPANAPLTISHIHSGVAGVAGPIVVDTGLTPGTVTLTNGSGSFTKAGVGVMATAAQAIINSPASFYFDVHTLLNSEGAVRGQLIRGN